ncbi:Leucine aminopeptidase 1, partial [Kappamyces sp. JEL0680]
MKVTSVLIGLAAAFPHSFTENHDPKAAAASLVNAAAPKPISAFPTAVAQSSAVNALLPNIDADKVKSWMTSLTLFPERYYQSQNGIKAAKWILDQVAALKAPAGTKLSVKFYNHTKFIQPSVIARYESVSQSGPIDTVITGSHFDTYAKGHPKGNGGENPAADDCASGSVAVFETLRILTTQNFIPKRPIEFHWYAGEEAGILGSNDIARDYAKRGVTVLGYLNLDQSGYIKPGTKPVIGIVTDYATAAGTALVRATVKAYTTLGKAGSTVDTKCGYACT